MQHDSEESSPRVSVPRPGPAGTPCRAAPTVPRPLRLLVVDDRPLVRRLVVDMSYDLGLRAAEAESAATALLLLLGTRGGEAASTVLVVAVGSGRGPEGLSLAGEAARRWPDAPPPSVVYIGAHRGVLGVRPLGERERFLAEPFGGHALARAAHEALGWPVPCWLTGRYPAPSAAAALP